MSDPLKRKLVFGDFEQIEALRKIRLQQKYDAEMLEQGLSRYKVNISISGDIDVELYAENDDDAKDVAWGEICGSIRDELDFIYRVKKLS